MAHVAEAILTADHHRPRGALAGRVGEHPAISPTLLGVPLATLKAPDTASSRVSAITLARATSRTSDEVAQLPAVLKYARRHSRGQ